MFSRKDFSEARSKIELLRFLYGAKYRQRTGREVCLDYAICADAEHAGAFRALSGERRLLYHSFLRVFRGDASERCIRDRTLAKRLLEKGVPVPRKEVRKQLAKALQIHVLLQKNNDSLLLNDYKKIVKCSVFPRNVNEYQDNYDHLQSVLQHSDTVNAVYTVSCLSLIHI